MMRKVSFSVFLLSFLVTFCFASEKQAKIAPVPLTDSDKSNLRGYSSQNEDELFTDGEKEGIISFPEIDVTTTSIEVNFFGDEETLVFVKETGWNTLSGFAWYGEDFNKTNSLNLSVRNSAEGVRYAGSASINNKVYSIVTLYDGKVHVREVDVSSFPSESEQLYFDDGERKLAMTMEYKTDASNRRSIVQGGSDNVVDIMCLYTPAALCHENGQKMGCNTSNSKFIATMDDKCALAVDETNTAFRMSGVESTANLVYSGLISSDYEEEKYMCHVTSLIRESNAPVYQRVRDLRNQYKADLISIIAHNVVHNGGNGDFAVCGCADVFWNNKDYAFGVVNRLCATATGFYSFAHEIGHNYGCFDDNTNFNTAALGYKDPNSQFRTLMAYNCNPNGCPRILRYSTPDQRFSYEGKPIGSISNNCADTINRNAASVANYMNGNTDANYMNVHSDPEQMDTSGSIPTTGPSLTCDKWNNVKVEIDVELKDGAKASDVSFSFINQLKPNNNLLEQEHYSLSGQTYKSETCVLSGRCFDFNLQNGGSVKSYNVIVDGVSHVSGQGGNFNTKTVTVSIDAKQKKFDGKRCRWLERQAQTSQICASTPGFASLCPQTCGSC